MSFFFFFRHWTVILKNFICSINVVGFKVELLNQVVAALCKKCSRLGKKRMKNGQSSTTSPALLFFLLNLNLDHLHHILQACSYIVRFMETISQKTITILWSSFRTHGYNIKEFACARGIDDWNTCLVSAHSGLYIIYWKKKTRKLNPTWLSDV